MSIYEDARNAALEIVEISGIKAGDTLAVGCSTSEVMGERMGTLRSPEVGLEIFNGIMSVLSEKGIYLAAQCCEHLNRAIVTERANAEKKGLEIVSVVPHPHAGGSFATVAFQNLKDPVVVEEIKAEAGIDIGLTLIGMHLKKVAVPVRLKQNTVGKAPVTAARTRPKYIGGERAEYV
ncbi:MAG: TIGR01440 family protein [Clostridia bacterium]|jgi:uncharacterized protein (TIGR01440 family)|nr:TIGR01440 family protein [Clostridia bacterium]